MNAPVRGAFEEEAQVLTAIRDARAHGLEVVDVYTPYPIHGIDEAMGIARSRLPWVTFAAGLCGGTLAMGFQIWTSAVGWALNVGGKPFLSIPAFIPVTFELTVLSAGLCSAFAFFARSKLWPGQRTTAPARSTSDRFVIEVRGDGAAAVLRQTGALDVAEAVS